MKLFVSTVAGVALLVCGVQAQTENKEAQHRETKDVLKIVTPKEGGFAFERHAIGTGPMTVEFVSTEANIAGKVVKNAPYSAEAVTESIQTLADGNRISRKSTASLSRDSQGRTRRDMTLPVVGPWATAGDMPSFVLINDPVAGVNYHLDSKAKIARKMPGNPMMVGFEPEMQTMAIGAGGAAFTAAAPVAGVAVAGSRVEVRAAVPDVMFNKQVAPPKSESLGKQIMDGIEVEGSRTTMTIAAGEIGNDREINIINERWYSPELQTVIMSKHADPRMGETIYKLTNVRRAEPHPSLFEVPADYTVEEPKMLMRKMQRVEKE